MTQSIKVADVPEFAAAPYLDSEAAIAAYLTDILRRTIRLCWPRRWETSPARAA